MTRLFRDGRHSGHGEPLSHDARSGAARRHGRRKSAIAYGGARHRVVIGKDTRLSGYMIEPALVAGFTAVGMDVVLFGPLPTPAVAMLTRSLRADLGVMISASHNKYDDNGIKLFGPDGYKLSDVTEARNRDDDG
jgi:phosphoglucosamine mutase